MANYVIHYLYAQNLQQNLMDAGVLEKLPDRHRAGVCGYTHRILYAKCHADDWADCLKEILERGVIDCSKKNEDGSYGVRRDYTPEEQKDLDWYPVHFNSPHEMAWTSRWTSDDNPGYYASRAIPEQSMIMTFFYEGSYDGGCYLKDGKKFADIPSIPVTFNPDEALAAAIDALKANGLDAFVDEMVNRYMSIQRAEGGRSIENLRFKVVLDYVSFNSADEVEDANSDVLEPGSSWLPF